MSISCHCDVSKIIKERLRFCIISYILLNLATLIITNSHECLYKPSSFISIGSFNVVSQKKRLQHHWSV